MFDMLLFGWPPENSTVRFQYFQLFGSENIGAENIGIKLYEEKNYSKIDKALISKDHINY
jgi:hypothetical protein